MLLSTSVCEIGSYNIIYWAKEVCNQQTKICEHCSVALSCNIQVCGFLVANLSVCDILAAEPTWIARNSCQNYLRQLFKPHRWKCDPLEAKKETQQGITCVSFWEKVSTKKKTWFGQIKEKVMFWRKNQAKNFFWDKFQGEFFPFFWEKQAEKIRFLLKKIHRKQSHAKVWRKFGESFMQNIECCTTHAG